jgi:predicted ATPase
MLALYRSGRQAEALEVYQATRTLLVDELGLNPDPRIQELHNQILNQDAVLTAPDRQEGRPTIRTPKIANAFIGRERELSAVGELLKDDGKRLLTLTGPGGSGKTRLAIEASTRAAMERSADVYWVPLAPLRDPSVVNRTVAQSFGVAEVAGTPVIETVATAQAKSSAIVLIDNCEHLVDAVADVASTLVDACPGLTIVTTSRERLGLRSEHVFAVPTMELEDGEALFHARASAARADFAPDPCVAEICQALDGLPLAIELAAARTRSLSPHSIRDRLSTRLALLTSRDRDVEERQRTLEATIAWSYDLLDPLEQRLLRVLSVFAGGCTLDAAEALVEADLELLESLLDKSLIRHRVDEAGQDRYWMLETIRDFAAQRLAEAGEAKEVSAAHRTFYLERAKSLRIETGATLDSREIKLFEAERANYRVVAIDSVAERDGDTAIEIAASLARLWWNVGEIADSYELVRAALELEGGTDAARVLVLCVASDFATSLGDLDEAHRFLEEAGRLASSMDDVLPKYQVLDARAWLYLHSGDYESASDVAEQASELGKSLENPAYELHAQTMMVQAMRGAAILREGGHDREALERCLQICRELIERASAAGLRSVRDVLTFELGQVYLALSQYSEALSHQQQSLRFELEAGRKWAPQDVLAIGITAGRLGDHITGLHLTSAVRPELEREGGLSPDDGLYLERLDAEAIAALGEDGYEAAVSAGEKLTLAEATELALRVTAPPEDSGA